MNQERVDLSNFYALQSQKQIYKRGYRDGQQFERLSRMDPYAKCWIHATAALMGVMAVLVLRNW